MADNINLFKNHLDKFWSSCEFVYSYIEPRAVAVSPYGWLMTHYGWLAG